MLLRMALLYYQTDVEKNKDHYLGKSLPIKKYFRSQLHLKEVEKGNIYEKCNSEVRAHEFLGIRIVNKPFP